MINSVTLVGRLTKDPELKYTPSNVAVATFTLAVSRPFANQQTGDRDADFIQCVVWRKQAENLSKFVGKGGLIGVQGRIQTRTYDDNTGARKYITEVLCDTVSFLESKGTTSTGNQPFRQETADDNQYANIDFSDNDLPF